MAAGGLGAARGTGATGSDALLCALGPLADEVEQVADGEPDEHQDHDCGQRCVVPAVLVVGPPEATDRGTVDADGPQAATPDDGRVGAGRAEQRGVGKAG